MRSPAESPSPPARAPAAEKLSGPTAWAGFAAAPPRRVAVTAGEGAGRREAERGDRGDRPPEHREADDGHAPAGREHDDGERRRRHHAADAQEPDSPVPVDEA